MHERSVILSRVDGEGPSNDHGAGRHCVGRSFAALRRLRMTQVNYPLDDWTTYAPPLRTRKNAYTVCGLWP